MKTEIKDIREDFNFDYETAESNLRWALETFGHQVAIASGFGAEDVVCKDMPVKINPLTRVFTLDTGRSYQETHDVMDEIRGRYYIKFDVYFPDYDKHKELVEANGPILFYQSTALRKLCCQTRKIDPLKQKTERA